MLKRNSIAMLVLLLANCALYAQRWEIGVGAGGGIYPSNTITRGSQSATTGFDKGFAATAYLGQNMYRRIGGEIRYTWQMNNLKLESGATKVAFAGRSQAIEYNLNFHFTNVENRLRPYALLGGGMKYYKGTGAEVVVQPLSSFGYLTRTTQWKPMFSAGAGLKFRMSPRLQLRVEARDSITPFPGQVIAAAPGATVNGWVNDILIFAGISLLF